MEDALALDWYLGRQTTRPAPSIHLEDHRFLDDYWTARYRACEMAGHDGLPVTTAGRTLPSETGIVDMSTGRMVFICFDDWERPGMSTELAALMSRQMNEPREHQPAGRHRLVRKHLPDLAQDRVVLFDSRGHKGPIADRPLAFAPVDRTDVAGVRDAEALLGTVAASLDNEPMAWPRRRQRQRAANPASPAVRYGTLLRGRSRELLPEHGCRLNGFFRFGR
jgi:hypothetical protein